MKIALQEGDIHTFLIIADNGRSLLVQNDWELPNLASTFGWSPCSCGATDGTIDCDHRTAGEMIAEAGDFLRAHTGDTSDDPGYF
jgi:hypothetical protein